MRGMKHTIYFLILVNLIFSQEVLAQRVAAVPDTVDLFELSLEELLNLEITTASKKAEKLSDAAGVISVVTQDELRRFGGTTLKDVLERVPGLIGFSIYMSDRSVISVRGDQVQASSSHVLLLINGRPVREVLESGIKSDVYESFPVNIIERIEVIKGPGSVLYGSTAFSGVINVITKTADETSVSVSGIGGDGGAYGAAGQAFINSGDLKIVAAGRYLKRADWETGYQMVDPDENVYEAKVDMPNKGTGSYVGVDFKGLSAMFSYNDWDNYYFIPYLEAHGNANWKKTFADIGYQLDVSENWSMNANVTYSNSKFEVSSYPNIKRNSYEVVAEWTNNIALSQSSKLVFGGLFNKIEGKETFYGLGFPIPISDASRNAGALYAQIDSYVVEKLKLIAGFQLNKFQDVDMAFVPRVGAIWAPVDKVRVKLLYSEAFRAPSINEFNLDHPTLKGNPGLKSEEVKTIDASISYQGEKGQIGFNYFISKHSDIIFQDRSADVAFYNNIGEVSFMGFELEGKRYFNENLFLNGSMLYQKNSDDEQTDLTPIANIGFKTGLSYRTDNGITLSVFNIYQGPLDDRFDAVLNQDPGSYNLLYFNSRFNLNKMLKMTAKTDIDFVFRVDNALGKEVWLPAWGLDQTQALPYNKGRSIFTELHFTF